MKKPAALLVSLLLAFALAACGGETTSGDSSSPSDSSAITNSDKPAGSSEDKEEKTDKEQEIPFEEITAVDNDQCLIKITGIKPDNIWGYTLTAYLENKSTEKTYMYSVESASINGVEVDPFFATEVAAGKKSNSEISFTDSKLSDNGIETFTDIEVTFRVYDSTDWSADAVAKETVHVYPFGEEKAEKFVREAQPTDTVIVDNENVSVVVTGYVDDSVWGYTANLYIENKTDEELTYSVDDVSVNGFMADPFWATSVGANKVAFAAMSWSDSTLEGNNIESIEEIEMNFRIYSSDDWTADDVFNAAVVLNP